MKGDSSDYDAQPVKDRLLHVSEADRNLLYIFDKINYR